MIIQLTAREQFWALKHAYRALRKSDREWKPDPYMDRRGMADAPQKRAERLLMSMPKRIRDCLVPPCVQPTPAQAATASRRNHLASIANRERAIADGIRQMRAIDAELTGSLVEQVESIKQLADEMVSEPPCRICRAGSPCWWHRNGFDQSRVAA